MPQQQEHLDQFMEKLENSANVHHVLLMLPIDIEFDDSIFNWKFAFAIPLNSKYYNIFYINQK